MQVSESHLIFDFEPNWKVRKYDDHPYYSRLSGAGLKAVDFITIYNNEHLVFWEIKNYRERKPNLRHDPLLALKENTEGFLKDMAQKAKDTLTALRAIDGYYKRSWTYSFRKRMMHFYETYPSEWYFWLKVYELSQRKNNLCFVLWLEGFELNPAQHIFFKNQLLDTTSKIFIVKEGDDIPFEGIKGTIAS